jgi:ABC-type multidrug transport system ATPase subunit
MNPIDPNRGSAQLSNLPSQNESNGFVLSAVNLAKRFNREWIFRNLTFDFKSGNRYAITGPNGSGKSTLLHVLWGQTPQSSGKLTYHHGEKEIPGEDIYRHVAIAAPYLDLIDEFTLQEQLEFHFKLKKARFDLKVPDLIEIMRLEHSRSKFLGNFSSGMKQRVKLALAFYTAADLIFLDEPGTNLDSTVFEWYLAEYQKLPSDVMVIVASNNPDEYPGKVTELNLLTFK